MGRKQLLGTKRLIRLRDEQWDALRDLADKLNAGKKKNKYNLTDLVSLAVDRLVGHDQSPKGSRKR